MRDCELWCQDLNSAAWFVLVQNLSEALSSQPSFAIPALTLIRRLLPISHKDPFIGLWRVYLKHGVFGNQLVETVLAYSHSSHTELADLATLVLEQVALVDHSLSSSIAVRIQQHFAPIIPSENGDIVAKAEKSGKRYEVWQWQRASRLLRNIVTQHSFSEEQSHHLVEALLTKLNALGLKETNTEQEI